MNHERRPGVDRIRGWKLCAIAAGVAAAVVLHGRAAMAREPVKFTSEADRLIAESFLKKTG